MFDDLDGTRVANPFLSLGGEYDSFSALRRAVRGKKVLRFFVDSVEPAYPYVTGYVHDGPTGVDRVPVGRVVYPLLAERADVPIQEIARDYSCCFFPK